MVSFRRILSNLVVGNDIVISSGSTVITGDTSTLTLVGAGKQATRVTALPPWHQLRVGGKHNVEVHVVPQDQEFRVELAADAAILPYLEAVVEEDRLEFRYTQNLHITGKTQTPFWEVFTPDPVHKVKITGSGEVRLFDLQQESLEARVFGSGNMMLTGQCRMLQVKIEGSGCLNARNLASDQADIKIQGSGMATAGARSCKARIEGSGEIFVPQSALCSSKIQGSGKLSRF